MSDKAITRTITIVVALVVVAIALIIFTKKVDAGQSCVKLSWGKVVDEAGPGLNFMIPVKNDFKCFDGRNRTLDILMPKIESRDPNTGVEVFAQNLPDTTSNYKDWPVEGRTTTGVQYTVSASITYRVPLDHIREIYQQGARDDDQIFEKGVKQPARTLIRQALDSYDAKTLYETDLVVLSQRVKDVLAPAMAEQGVTLISFGIKETNFDDAYEQSIRNKNREIEAKEQAVLAQATARENAITAGINATANQAGARAEVDTEVYRTTQTTAAQVQATIDLGNANAEAKAAEYKAINDAIKANPDLLVWMNIDAIREAGAVYLPDTALPLLNLPVIGAAAQP